jgi:Deacetylases, including yeast histone deacetylase and acetoin utilization protein
VTTGFLYDPAYLEHGTARGHPECRERLIATMNFLEQQAWFTKLKRVAPHPVERQWIEAIHSEKYIARAEQVCQRGLPYLDVPDVSISRHSYDVALLAAGGTVALADQLISGEIHNGFALVRPPGHHAEKDMALGFCLFNNVAILVRYLQKHHGLDKILILDWDVHHGNGTQHTFEEDPSVLYISIHQYPYYPGTGAASETGTGRGEGATLNCPMPAGAGDREYEDAFMERILPKIDEFKPEAVILSAGFDAHIDDPLAQICLSTEFFGWMSERLMEKAGQYAGGRLISVLEGGYNLKMLPRCIGKHLAVLSGSQAQFHNSYPLL